MANSPILEIVKLTLKPEANLEEEGSEANKTWKEVTQIISNRPEVTGQWFGRQLEDGGIGVWAVSTSASFSLVSGRHLSSIPFPTHYFSPSTTLSPLPILPPTLCTHFSLMTSSSHLPYTTSQAIRGNV